MKFHHFLHPPGKPLGKYPTFMHRNIWYRLWLRSTSQNAHVNFAKGRKPRKVITCSKCGHLQIRWYGCVVVPPFIKHTQCFIDARLVSVATKTASGYQQQASFANSQFNKTVSGSLAHHCSNGTLQLVTVIIEDRLILPGHSIIEGFEKVVWEEQKFLVSSLVQSMPAIKVDWNRSMCTSAFQ